MLRTLEHSWAVLAGRRRARLLRPPADSAKVKRLRNFEAIELALKRTHIAFYEVELVEADFTAVRGYVGPQEPRSTVAQARG
jgi:hypothetical protein